MTNNIFESASYSAIAAGLGALHLRHKLKNIQEFGMSDVADKMTDAADWLSGESPIKRAAKRIGKKVIEKAQDNPETTAALGGAAVTGAFAPGLYRKGEEKVKGAMNRIGGAYSSLRGS